MFNVPENCVIPAIGVGNLETKQLDYHWFDEKSIEWLTNVIREAYEKEGQNESLVE